MGIYIPNMKMPDSCFSCPLSTSGFMELSLFCTQTGNHMNAARAESERLRFCPLIEVPAHGRLIDADALEENAQKRLLICSKNDNQFQKPYEVMRAIDNASTVIPADKEET